MKCIFIFILTLGHIIASAQIHFEQAVYANKNNRELIIKNNIKSATVTTKSGDREWIYKLFFDTDGYPSRSTHLYRDTVRTAFNYTRNITNGSILRERVSIDLPCITDTLFYQYGRLMKETMWVVVVFSKDNVARHFPGEIKYRYNDSGFLIGSYRTTFFENHSSRSATTYSYDSLGLLEATCYISFDYDRDTTGTINSKKLSIYKDGLKIRDEEVVSESNNFGGTHTYLYDSTGKLIRTLRANGTSEEYIYNNDGLLSLIKVSMNPGHLITDEISYEYWNNKDLTFTK